MATLGALVRDRAHLPEEPPLLTFVAHDPAGGYQVTHRHYASLWRRGQAMARALAAHGLKTGDRFALVMQNHAEFVDAMIASAILGTVFVPVDPRTRGKKLEYMLASVECKGVIAGRYCLDALRDVLQATPTVKWVWLLGTPDASLALPPRTDWLDRVVDAGSTSKHASHRAPQPDLPLAIDDLDAPMQMLFTSGTTGDPKAIIGPYRRYAGVGLLMPYFQVKATDRMYTGLSLTHANALAITLGGSLYCNIRSVFSQKFTKSRLWSIIRDFDCTTMNLLGGMFSAIYSEPPDARDADNPMRMVIGAGMPRNLWEPFSRRFGVEVLEFYGAAEGGFMVNPPGTGPIGSIGKSPPSHIVHILDDNDHECAAGVPGEIVFENADGSQANVQYFRNAAASEKKTRGGWLRMGDIGYRDDQGWHYYLYRQGNEIRRNGDFISPGFVEKELAEHPDIDDVFVYGVNSANGTPGEKDVVAAIVVNDRAKWNAQAVFEYCASRLEANSMPSYLQLVEEIPKTASEKPLERILLESFSPSAANVFVKR